MEKMLMKLIGIICSLVLATSGFSDGSSLLTHSVELDGFGSIKYRPPVVQSDETPIVLFHGIYGGANHRSWRQLHLV